MPWGLKRYQQSRQSHFVTSCCYHRRQLFASPASKEIFESSLERVRQVYGLCVYGYVVMPEHIHLLVSEPTKGTLADALKCSSRACRGGRSAEVLMQEIIAGNTRRGNQGRTTLQVLTLFGLVIVVIACAFWVYLFPKRRPPEEDELFRQFSSHRDVYEHLRGMLLADAQVRAVYPRFGVETKTSATPRNPSEIGFPAGRFNAYVAYLKQVTSPEVFRMGDNDSAICVVMWTSGFGGDTRHVNVCSLATPPTNTVDHLNDFYRRPKPRQPVFRHVEGNWYLWADW